MTPETASPSLPISWVSTPYELEQAALRWQDNPEVAIDTEFRFESTYRPELSLIQVASLERVWLLDALALEDLTPLATGLLSRPGLKVLHAIAGDSSALATRQLELRAPLLDTQVAALFCGFRTGISMAELARMLLGLELPKAETRSNWMQRPLSRAQVHYAATDVEVVGRLTPVLRRQLELRGRWSWALEESERLSQTSREDLSLKTLWHRFRPGRKLQRAAQERAWALLVWREMTARKENRARPFLLRDETLLDLARRGAVPQDPSRNLPGFDPRRHQIWIDHWQNILEGTFDFELPPLPESPQSPGPCETRLQTFVTECLGSLARSLELPESFLLSRSDRERLALSPDLEVGLQQLTKWRREVLGEALCAWFASNGNKSPCGKPRRAAQDKTSSR